MGDEPISCDQGCRKNDAFTQLATLPTKLTCHNQLPLILPMISAEMKEMRMFILNYKDTTITTRTGLEFGEYGKPCLPSTPENKASLLCLIGPDSFKFLPFGRPFYFCHIPAEKWINNEDFQNMKLIVDNF